MDIFKNPNLIQRKHKYGVDFTFERVNNDYASYLVQAYVGFHRLYSCLFDRYDTARRAFTWKALIQHLREHPELTKGI